MSKDKERKKRNEEILAKLKRGESLSLCTPSDTWFPDRSKGFIKKDHEAISRIYGDEESAKKRPKLVVVKADE